MNILVNKYMYLSWAESWTLNPTNVGSIPTRYAN